MMERRKRRSDNGYAISRDLTPRHVPVADCQPLGRATRKHSPKQVRKLTASLEKFGFVCPILIDAKGRVVAGWGLVLAARQLGLGAVPAVCLTDLSDPDLRMLRLALNRIAEDSTWDREMLGLEFCEIQTLEPQSELIISGFEMGEIDASIGNGIDQEDDLPLAPEPRAAPVTRPGDVWHLGDHRVACGDALLPESYGKVLGTDKAEMSFSDPPYNLRIADVSGLGATKHTEFAMASGEMSSAEFEAFLQTSFRHAANWSQNGAIHFVCMDWRHLSEVSAAGRGVYSELKNLCIWNKTNAGMGTLYRGKHELIFVFKVGKQPHINNVALGRYGRNRPNVWDYFGQNTLSGTTKSKLALHPTVKPVALVADAICDCSNRGGLILDPFGGAGTTLIAAERTGRRARLIELDPGYVDVIVERWQRLTGRTAVRAVGGQPFTRPAKA